MIRGAWSVETEQQYQETNVLPLPVKQVPVRKNWNVSTPAIPGTSSRRERGIFEKMKGSGIWWIRYADAYGRERREKAGTRGIAIRLYQKPKNEALPGKQLPESIRRKQFFVSDLLELAADYVRSHYQGQRLGADGKDYRYSALKGAFGSRPADTVTGSGNRARPVKAGRRALCDNGLIRFAKVAELADAPDLGSGPARGGGSSPPFRTSKLLRARDTAQKCSKNFSGRILGS